MSMKRAVSVAAWNRDEHDGSYRADLHGHGLCVKWTPNTAEARGSFRWTAERGDEKTESPRSYEEMAEAMVYAEMWAEAHAPVEEAAA